MAREPSSASRSRSPSGAGTPRASPGRPTRSGPALRRYAVRREPEDGLLAPYDTEGQYRLHEALLRLGGVPVPRPALARARPVGARDAVLRHGPRRRARAGAVEARRPDRVPGRGRAACRGRAVRRRAGGDPRARLARDRAAGEPRDEVAHWERLLDEAVLVEVPLLREAIAWLRANRASSGRVALVPRRLPDRQLHPG